MGISNGPDSSKQPEATTDITREREDLGSISAHSSRKATSRRADNWWGQRRGLFDDAWYIVKPRYSRELESLKTFTLDERQEILAKREILSSLAHFIGKDFRLPVYLGEPGSGWYWNPEENSVTIDSRDVLRNPLSFLRFVTCHEGAHRRISRIDQVPDGLGSNKGFMMLLNAVEDPRVNNYLCDTYPILENDMHEAICFSLAGIDKTIARVFKERGSLPLSVVAMSEIIQEWFQDRTEHARSDATHERDPKVVEFIEATRSACQRAYYTYPCRQETERGERAAHAYSAVAYRIIAEEIWPHFQGLLERDRRDALAYEIFKQLAAQSSMPSEAKSTQLEKPEGSGEKGETTSEAHSLHGHSKEASRPEHDSKPSLGDREGSKSEESVSERPQAEKNDHQAASTDQPQEFLISSDALQAALAKGLCGSSLTEVSRSLASVANAEGAERSEELAKQFSQLSERTKEELAQCAEHLSDETKKALEELIRIFLQGLQVEISNQLKGQLAPQPATADSTQSASTSPGTYTGAHKDDRRPRGTTGDGAIRTDFTDGHERIKFRDKIRSVLQGEKSVYSSHRSKVLPVIDLLERDLRRLFQERRASKLEEGKRFGPTMDLDRRISECASGVSAAESRSFTKRTQPTEKDYAISILVDLSGSMRRGNRIEETFRATIALAEVLNRLGVNFEILGFNCEIHEFKTFHQRMSPEVRDKMATMPDEVEYDSRARYNDDGWALTVVSERLDREKNENKFLIVLSDGLPEPSNAHATPQFELSRVIAQIRKPGDKILIGLGVGKDTGHVKSYYPNSIADISVKELPKKLAEILEQAIRNPEQFSK